MIPGSTGRGMRLCKVGKGREPVVCITEVPLWETGPQYSSPAPGWDSVWNTSQLFSLKGVGPGIYIHQLSSVTEGCWRKVLNSPALLACLSCVSEHPEKAFCQRISVAVNEAQICTGMVSAEEMWVRH